MLKFAVFFQAAMRYFSIFKGDNPSILVKLLFPSQECGEFRRFRGPKGDDEIRVTDVGPTLLNWKMETLM